MRVLSSAEVEKKVSYSTRHIKRLVKAGKFPRPIKLGGRKNGWIEEEIDRHIEGFTAARDTVAA